MFDRQDSFRSDYLSDRDSRYGIVQQASIDSTDSRLCYLTSSEVSLAVSLIDRRPTKIDSNSPFSYHKEALMEPKRISLFDKIYIQGMCIYLEPMCSI